MKSREQKWSEIHQAILDEDIVWLSQELISQKSSNGVFETLLADDFVQNSQAIKGILGEKRKTIPDYNLFMNLFDQTHELIDLISNKVGGSQKIINPDSQVGIGMSYILNPKRDHIESVTFDSLIIYLDGLEDHMISHLLRQTAEILIEQGVQLDGYHDFQKNETFPKHWLKKFENIKEDEVYLRSNELVTGRELAGLIFGGHHHLIEFVEGYLDIPYNCFLTLPIDINFLQKKLPLRKETMLGIITYICNKKDTDTITSRDIDEILSIYPREEKMRVADQLARNGMIKQRVVLGSDKPREITLLHNNYTDVVDLESLYWVGPKIKIDEEEGVISEGKQGGDTIIKTSISNGSSSAHFVDDIDHNALIEESLDDSVTDQEETAFSDEEEKPAEDVSDTKTASDADTIDFGPDEATGPEITASTTVESPISLSASDRLLASIVSDRRERFNDGWYKQYRKRRVKSLRDMIKNKQWRKDRHPLVRYPAELYLLFDDAMNIGMIKFSKNKLEKKRTELYITPGRQLIGACSPMSKIYKTNKKSPKKSDLGAKLGFTAMRMQTSRNGSWMIKARVGSTSVDYHISQGNSQVFRHDQLIESIMQDTRIDERQRLWIISEIIRHLATTTIARFGPLRAGDQLLTLHGSELIRHDGSDRVKLIESQKKLLTQDDMSDLGADLGKLMNALLKSLDVEQTEREEYASKTNLSDILVSGNKKVKLNEKFDYTTDGGEESDTGIKLPETESLSAYLLSDAGDYQARVINGELQILEPHPHNSNYRKKSKKIKKPTLQTFGLDDPAYSSQYMTKILQLFLGSYADQKLHIIAESGDGLVDISLDENNSTKFERVGSHKSDLMDGRQIKILSYTKIEKKPKKGFFNKFFGRKEEFVTYLNDADLEILKEPIASSDIQMLLRDTHFVRDLIQGIQGHISPK